jgi:hypothetical protein
MNLILENRRGETLNIEYYNGRTEPTSFKVERERLKKFGQYGIVSKGDGLTSDRSIQIRYDVIAERDINYDEIINTIASFFDVEDEPFYLVNLDTQKRCRVSLENLEESYQEGLAKRIGIGCKLNLKMESALWEERTETIVSETVNNNGSINIFLPLNSKETYSIIDITSLDVGTNGDFALILQNSNTGFSSAIRIKDSNFVQNAVMTIDGINGTVSTNGVNANVKISDGNFFPLKKGNNNIIYQSVSGQSVLVTFKYRVRTVL